MQPIVDPYENANWSTDQQVISFSHAHSRVKRNDGQRGEVKQRYLDNVIAGGATHIPFSNYYPSEPFYPLTDWFESVPEGVIGSPNAEHHNIIGWNNLHINGLGCTYSSGNPGGVEPAGINMGLEGAIKTILNTLQYRDGGGITINHPGWSVAMNQSGWTAETEFDGLMKMLDIDERVLGIEIQSTYGLYAMGSGPDYEANSRAIWDQILMTGKRCWGFCVPDHETEYGQGNYEGNWTGRNILLVDEFTEYKCLKAYRDGNFYSRIFNSNLAFSGISFNNDHISASAPLAEKIRIIIDGEATEISGTSASVEVPNDATFVRIEATMPYTWTDWNGSSHDVTEIIYSNPYIFKPYAKKKKKSGITDFIIME